MLPSLSALRLAPAQRPMPPRGRPLGVTAEERKLHPELIRRLDSLKKQLFDAHARDRKAEDAERALREILYGFFVAEGQQYDQELRYYEDMERFTAAFHQAAEIWQILLRQMLLAVVNATGGPKGDLASAVRVADEVDPTRPKVLPGIYPPPPPAPVGLYAEDGPCCSSFSRP